MQQPVSYVWLHIVVMHNCKMVFQQVHIRSTNVDRTLMSAEAQLAGFFPPQGDQVLYNM